MVDWIAMLGNLSESLPSVQTLLGGLSYVLGLIFLLSSLQKFKANVDTAGRGKHIVPLAYFLAACGLFFLPSVLGAFSTTLFGTSYNILAYSPASESNVYHSVAILIQTAGLLWFIRGCVLLAHASQPEQGQEGSKGLGPKGLTFVIAGVFAMNIESTVQMLNHAVSWIMSIDWGAHIPI